MDICVGQAIRSVSCQHIRSLTTATSNDGSQSSAEVVVSARVGTSNRFKTGRSLCAPVQHSFEENVSILRSTIERCLPTTGASSNLGCRPNTMRRGRGN